MENLSRIASDSINSLVEDVNLLKSVECGCISSSWCNKNIMLIETSDERLIIKTDKNIKGSDRKAFLRYANEILEECGLYMAGVEYMPARFQGLFPHKLEGNFYKGITDNSLSVY